MNIWITNHYNEPSCFIRVASAAKKYIREQLEGLLEKYPIKVKAHTLEILLCNDGTDRFEVIKTSTGRGHYLSFQFWLPYPKITKNKVTDLESFTNFLFEGLILALEPFGIPKSEIQKIQEIVKNELVENPKYVYVPSRDELVMEKILAEMKEKYKDNPNIII